MSSAIRVDPSNSEGLGGIDPEGSTHSSVEPHRYIASNRVRRPTKTSDRPTAPSMRR